MNQNYFIKKKAVKRQIMLTVYKGWKLLFFFFQEFDYIDVQLY